MKTAIREIPRHEGFENDTSMVSVGSGHKIGYARVSTDEQILDLQIRALKAAGCLNIYEEKVSGAGKKRPQLDLAIKELQPGDTLMVWRIDRLARSMPELYARLSEINATGATLRSVTEAWNFDTAMGKAYLGMLGLFAELERQNTISRTKAGMEAAKARGAQIGATIKFTEAKQEKAYEWLKKGVKPSVVARRLRLSVGTISIFKKSKRL